MLIPVKHRKFLYELTENEFYGLKEAHKFLKDFFGKESYFSFSRDSFAERSVEHFHTHFMPGRLRRKSLVTML
jgi:diadenosine tetraphosphate (Ap4A) HIT family hydrolase